MSPYATHSIITTLEPIDTYISHTHVNFMCYCLTQSGVFCAHAPNHLLGSCQTLCFGIISCLPLDSIGKFLTHLTSFNDSSWGNQTRGFIKLISKKLRLESYDKIIDLTADEPSDEFVMLVDVSLDDNKDSKIAIIENDCVGCDINKWRGWMLEGVDQGMSTRTRMVKSQIMMMNPCSLIISGPR